MIQKIKYNKQITKYLMRFSVRLVSSSAATRTLTSFVVRPVDVTVTFWTSMKCDDIDSCGLFQYFVALRKVWRQFVVEVLLEQLNKFQACLGCTICSVLNFSDAANEFLLIDNGCIVFIWRILAILRCLCLNWSNRWVTTFEFGM